MPVIKTPSPPLFSTATPSVTSLLLFGEVLVDRFPDREVQGGAPFNVAHHLLGLGREAGVVPILLSRIGKDARGHRLLERIQAAGLSVEGIQQDDVHHTGEVLVSLGGEAGGHSFEIGPDQAWDFIQSETARCLEVSYRPKWIYFGTLAQRAGSHSALRALLETTQARRFLDINLRDPWVRDEVLRWSLQQAQVVKVSEEELLRVADMFGLGNGTLQELGERLIQAFDIDQLLVTQGDQGAWVLTADGVQTQTKADTSSGNPIAIVDTVGAGDAFSAVFLLGLTQGWSIEQTLERAHAFAGRICGLRGAIPDTSDFYRTFIADWYLAEEQSR